MILGTNSCGQRMIFPIASRWQMKTKLKRKLNNNLSLYTTTAWTLNTVSVIYIVFFLPPPTILISLLHSSSPSPSPSLHRRSSSLLRLHGVSPSQPLRSSSCLPLSLPTSHSRRRCQLLWSVSPLSYFFSR